MNIREIEDMIGHEELLLDGWKVTGVQMGCFQRYGSVFETPILIYKKKKYLHSMKRRVENGYYVRYYNEFGFICSEEE